MRQGGLIRTCSRCAFEEKNEKKTKSRRTQSTPASKCNCLVMETSYVDMRAALHTKGHMSDMPSVQPTKQPRTSPPGSRGSEHMPRHVSCGCLPECSVSPAMTAGAARCVLSKLENFFEVEKQEDRTGLGCELLY